MNKKTRISLITLSLSLVLITTILSSSAYLTDSDSTTSSFRLATGADFGIQIDGTEFNDELIFPGDTFDLVPKVINNGSYPAYVFAEIDKSDEFSIVGLSDDWKQLTSVSDRQVYYYGGTDNENHPTLTSLDPDSESLLFQSVKLSEDVSLQQEGESDELRVTVTFYAIQTANMSSTDPATVWGLIGQ